MTKKGQAVTNPRISAGATNVMRSRSAWESGLREYFQLKWRTGAAVYLTSVNHINIG